MAHVVAVTTYDGLLGYECGIVSEVFGLQRPDLTQIDYELKTCRVEPGTLRTSHGLRVDPDGSLIDLTQADTVIVPGWRDVHERPPQALLDALRGSHENGARVVAICSGAFALAHAGLLDDQTVTTHWLFAQQFRTTFPHIDLDPHPLFLLGTNNTATSAGSSAGMDLCLALVEHDHSSYEAAQIARRMVVTHRRPGTQGQFAQGDECPNTIDGPLGELLTWIEGNLEQDITIDLLAGRAHLSRRTLIRRFRETTGTTPMAWITQRRVQRARRLLETTDLSVREAASSSGLGSPTNLRNRLTATTGLTPTQYRKAHRRTERR